MSVGPFIEACVAFEELPADMVFGAAAILCFVVSLADQVIRFRESTANTPPLKSPARRRGR